MKVLINGFGRIGRAITRVNMEKNHFDIVAINDINPDNKNIAYLLKYDCTYGRLKKDVASDEAHLIVDDKKIKITHEKNIKDIDMAGIDIVIDSSGIASNIKQIEEMAEASNVKHFIITNVDSKKAKNIILGVNEDTFDSKKDKVLSSSICDAVALAPIYNILQKEFTINSGYLVTLHPWLSYQNLLDGPSISWSQPGDVYSHYALGRATTQNLIPKSTSAVRAVSYVIPEITEKVDSFSYRVPTQIVSSAVLTAVLDKDTTAEHLLELFHNYEKKQNFKIIQSIDEPLISIDYLGNDYSAIIDSRWIKINNKNHIKLVYWYDNEWGYSSRVVDMAKYIIGKY